MSELFSHVVDKDLHETELPVLSRHGEDTPTGDSILDHEVLNMEPVFRPQTMLSSLDDKSLLNMARASVLSQITVSSLA